MSRLKSPPLWTIVPVFLLGIILVPLTCQFRTRREPPTNLAELAARIQAAHPDWKIVKASPNRPDGLKSGFYVCDHDCPADYLASLFATPQSATRWKGIVLCQQRPEPREDVGEMGAHVDNFELFGDPEMLLGVVSMLTASR